MTVLDFSVRSARLSASAYVISLGGEIDLYAAPQLDDELSHAINQGATRLIVDLASATFIDSSVLSVLLRAAARLRARGGEIVVACGQPPVCRAFDVSGLNGYFVMEPSLTDALCRPRAAGTPA